MAFVYLFSEPRHSVLKKNAFTGTWYVPTCGLFGWHLRAVLWLAYQKRACNRASTTTLSACVRVARLLPPPGNRHGRRCTTVYVTPPSGVLVFISHARLLDSQKRASVPNDTSSHTETSQARWFHQQRRLFLGTDSLSNCRDIDPWKIGPTGGLGYTGTKYIYTRPRR